MPRFDGTGPLGFGPGTGWGMVLAVAEWVGEEVLVVDLVDFGGSVLK